MIIILLLSRFRDILYMSIFVGGTIMPVLSRFYGIVIKMYFQQAEHNPPHIHAIYGDDTASIDIQTGDILEGYLPPKALSMVQEWIGINKKSLLKMWKTQEFKTLAPLE